MAYKIYKTQPQRAQKILKQPPGLRKIIITISHNGLENNMYMYSSFSPFIISIQAPDPSTVRPVVVLQKSLTFVLSRWEKDSDYHFSCEQFKSIRQDLTVSLVFHQYLHDAPCNIYIYIYTCTLRPVSKISFDGVNMLVSHTLCCTMCISIICSYGSYNLELGDREIFIRDVERKKERKKDT